MFIIVQIPKVLIHSGIITILVQVIFGVIVYFVALLTIKDEMIIELKNKFLKKNCDLLVVNDLFEDGAGFKTDTNKVALITKNFVDYLDLMSKEDLAHIILEKLMKVKGE